MIPIVYVMVDERLQRFDYTYNFLFGGTAFVMAKPTMEIQWQALFRPLSGLVWVGVAASIIAVAASLQLVSGDSTCPCSRIQNFYEFRFLQQLYLAVSPE